MKTITRAAAALAGAALLTPAAAQAATKTVFAGYGGAPGAPKQLDVTAFLRHQVTIHVGDSVKWQFRGFHDIAFLGTGTTKPGFADADPANPVKDVKDAGGNPFWFNGQPRIALNPKVAFPAGGKSYNGKVFTGSGLPDEAGKPKPYSLKFTKAGTFNYYCLLHPGMAGSVKVVGKTKKVPTAKQDAAAAKKEGAAIIAVAKKREKAAPIGGLTVEAGRATSEYTLNEFFPAKLAAKVGDTVTFTMNQQSQVEVHTVTFGSDAVTKPVVDGFISPVPNAAGPPALVLDPRSVYPSDPPGPTPPAYDGTNHGNGFFNLGLLDNVKPSPQPNEAKITFTKAGTYTYLCVIHEGMKGEIDVS